MPFGRGGILRKRFIAGGALLIATVCVQSEALAIGRHASFVTNPAVPHSECDELFSDPAWSGLLDPFQALIDLTGPAWATDLTRTLWLAGTAWRTCVLRLTLPRSNVE